MSSSEHPIALSLERQVGDATKLLAIVMCLPLVDGLFPALVLAGALDSVTGILEVGLLVFGGSAMVAIIIAEMDDTPRRQARIVLGVGAVVITLAIVEAALAPTLAGLLNLAVFERFAGVVILAVAASTASARIGEYLPRPAVIVALGLVASVDPAGATLVVDARPDLMVRAAAAAGVGVGFALVVALVSPWLRNAVDLDRFRFGSAVALGVLPLSIYGIIPSNAPLALAVLVVTAIFAFDPGRARERDWEYEPDDIDITAALSNGGNPNTQPVDERVDSDGSDYDDERLPWL
ncbi:DUF5794 domain-containing protein [Salinibaculum salinum]|uniref:DUF5794 domain-containing protein n=1 Tax=Salinibaculum salinum TaxID=3131996 RepID=UPI0030EC227F